MSRWLASFILPGPVPQTRECPHSLRRLVRVEGLSPARRGASHRYIYATVHPRISRLSSHLKGHTIDINPLMHTPGGILVTLISFTDRQVHSVSSPKQFTSRGVAQPLTSLYSLSVPKTNTPLQKKRYNAGKQYDSEQTSLILC